MQIAPAAVDLRLADASVLRTASSRPLAIQRWPRDIWQPSLDISQPSAVPKLTITISEGILAKIEQLKPDYLDRSAFLNLLLDQQLDAPGTLGLASASEASPSNSSSYTEEEFIKPRNKTNTRACAGARARGKGPYSAKAIDPELVPADLLDCQQLLPEFWAVKKGTRTEGVWNRVCGKLRGWTPEQRREALTRAIASGWGDVFEPPAARASQHSLPLSPTGTPMTVGEQIAASAIANIRAMEERRAAA